MCLVGTGTTLTLTDAQTVTPGDGLNVGRIIEFADFTEELTAIDDNDIGTSGHNQLCPGKLIEHGALSMTIAWDGIEVSGDPHKYVVPPLNGKIYTALMQFPAPGGMTTGAQLSGSVFVRLRGIEGVVNNERITQGVELTFTGKSGDIQGDTHSPPTWTAAAA